MEIGTSFRSAGIQRHGTSKPLKKIEPVESIKKHKSLKEKKKALLDKIASFDEKTINELLHCGMIDKKDIRNLTIIKRKNKL